MILITLVVACAIGAIAGIVNVAVLEASVWHGLLTYVAISIAVPAIVTTLSLLRPEHSAHSPKQPRSEDAELEAWHDWQFEEEAELMSALEREAASKDTQDVKRSA